MRLVMRSRLLVFAVLIIVFAAVAPVVAKDKPLTGIILFPSDSGPAYAQVTTW